MLQIQLWGHATLPDQERPLAVATLTEANSLTRPINRYKWLILDGRFVSYASYDENNGGTMSDYERTSQICPFSQIRPILQLALKQQATEYNSGQIPADLLICIETVSQRKETNLFTHLKNKIVGLPTPGSVQYSAAAITPGWLIWAFTHWNSNSQATALSVRLDEAEISDYPLDHLVEDHGLNILGFISGSTERSLQFLGLGHGTDSKRFKQVLQQAVQAART